MNRCVPILSSLLIVDISTWNSDSRNATGKENAQVQTTQLLLEILEHGRFLPFPLNLIAPILPSLRSKEISKLMLIVWSWLKQTQTERASVLDARIIQPLKQIFHRNIETLCYSYHKFFPDE